jgi:site-specific recombinase XerD
MILYKRHLSECQHANGSKKDTDHSHRCQCSLYVEWSVKGKQFRKAVRDASGQPVTSWSEAEKLVQQNRQTGNPASTPAAALTIADAVNLFLDSKTAEGVKPPTMVKYRLTLNRLTEHFQSQGVTLLTDVTSPLLLEWSDTWNYYKSAVAKLNNQSRLGTFFEFCLSREYVSKNPMKRDDAFKKKSRRLGKLAKKERQETISPLEPKEYAALVKAVDLVPKLTATATARVKALMHLQRYAGLAIIDAACLSKEELIKDGDVYRIKTDREKSRESVNNVIPAWLAEELLAVKNGNPRYFFWTGESTSKSAVSYFDKLYRKVFAKAGIATDGQLSHRLRHTFAVELLKAGVDIRKVSIALGHASVTTTERYYAKWNAAQQVTLDAALSGAWE